MKVCQLMYQLPCSIWDWCTSVCSASPHRMYLGYFKQLFNCNCYLNNVVVSHMRTTAPAFEFPGPVVPTTKRSTFTLTFIWPIATHYTTVWHPWQSDPAPAVGAKRCSAAGHWGLLVRSHHTGTQTASLANWFQNGSTGVQVSVCSASPHRKLVS